MLALHLTHFQVVSKSQAKFLQSEKNLQKSSWSCFAHSHDLGCLVYDGQKLNLFLFLFLSLFLVFLIYDQIKHV